MAASEINWMQRILIGKVNKNLTGFVNIRIDRATPLGNPYVMHREEQRQEVCDLYATFLNDVLANESSEAILDQLQMILDHLLEGDYVNLQCWCSPEHCHGEHIRKVLIDVINDNGLTPKK